MRLVNLMCLGVCAFLVACDIPVDRGDNNDDDKSGDASSITMNFEGAAVSLDGGPATRGGGQITINGGSNSTGIIRIVISGSATGTYDINSAGLTFTSAAGQMHTAATADDVEHGAELSVEITEVSPGLKGTFSATVIQSYDPNFTAKEITSGVINITGTDYVNL